MRVACPAHAGCAVAGGNVQEATRRVRPDILHVRRQHHRAAPRQRGGVHIHVVLRQLRTDACIERYKVLHVASYAHGSTITFACCPGLASSANAAFTPSSPTWPVTSGVTSSLPSAMWCRLAANSSPV